MRMSRSLLIAAAVLLPAWQATAAVLGPSIEVPVEWVWIRDPRTRALVKVSPLRDFAVASNGTDFFVAWRQRALAGTVGPSGEPPRTARAGVFGARIDAAGNLLDAVPIALPLAGVERSFSDLSNQWLAFAESSDSYLACSDGCARVDSCGALLDANPIEFPSGGLPSSGMPVVVSDGEDHFVLLGNEMFFVGPEATVVSHPLAFSIGSVASDGNNFLNVTRTGITSFDSHGGTLNAAALPFQASKQPAVTFDGDDYLILWAGIGPDGAGKYVTRASSEGEPLGTSARLALPDVRGGVFDLGFRISFDGMNAVATWCDVCTQTMNEAPIAVIQAEDSVIATQVDTAGPLLRALAVASNSDGVSIVVVDGFKPWLPSPALNSFFPVVQFVTTTPERDRQDGKGDVAARKTRGHGRGKKCDGRGNQSESLR